MFDSLFEHLTPSMFLIALAGHVIAEGSAKLTLSSLRNLGYLAAVAMLPILIRQIENHRESKDTSSNPRKTKRYRFQKSRRSYPGYPSK